MNTIFFCFRTKTLYSCIVLLILLSACRWPTLATPITTPPPEIDKLTITPAETAKPTTIAAPTVTASQPSFLSFPYISADAGKYSLLAGETITITWENAPMGADRYEFILVPINKAPFIVGGIDIDASDGVAVPWTFPDHAAAELHATAYFRDGQKIESNAYTIYSGDFPPSGECSLIARHQPVEVYRLPDRTAEIFALLHPAVYAHVLEIAPNSWYRIDASVVGLFTPPLGNLPDTGFRDVAVSIAMNFDLSPQVEMVGLIATKVCFW